MTALRVAVVAVAGALGALFAMGCVLAALFEAQGFGSERDTDPSTGYLLLLAAAFVASVGVPFWLWRQLLPGSAPRALLVFAVTVAGVIAILGIGFS